MLPISQFFERFSPHIIRSIFTRGIAGERFGGLSGSDTKICVEDAAQQCLVMRPLPLRWGGGWGEGLLRAACVRYHSRQILRCAIDGLIIDGASSFEDDPGIAIVKDRVDFRTMQSTHGDQRCDAN